MKDKNSLNINKKIHRFYLPSLAKEIEQKKEIILEDKNLLNQFLNVLKFKISEKVILFTDNGYDYLYEILSISKKAILLKFISKKQNINNSNIKINLGFALLKKENTELVLEKCTELGVSKFSPLITNRTIKTGWNYNRNIKILSESIEQSGRGNMPEIEKEVIRLDKFIEKTQKDNLANYSFLRGQNNIFVLDFNGKNIGEYKKEIENIKKNNQFINIIVGPEGGFSDNEREIFKKNNLQIISLGESILRGETACIAIISILQNLF